MSNKIIYVDFTGAEADVALVSIFLPDGRELIINAEGEFEVWRGSTCGNEELIEEGVFDSLDEGEVLISVIIHGGEHEDS